MCQVLLGTAHLAGAVAAIEGQLEEWAMAGRQAEARIARWAWLHIAVH